MSTRGLVLLVGGLLGLMVAAYLVAPQPVDTRVRLEREGAAPFDAEVLFAMLPAWVGAEVIPVAETPYERLADTTLVGTSYVFLARTFAPDRAEARRLLRYVARGNTVLVATNVLDGPFGEALGTRDTTYDGRRGLRSGWNDDLPFLARAQLGDGDTLRLVAPGAAGRYGFPVWVQTATLLGIDPERTVIRGVTPDPAAMDTTLVRVRWGRGHVVVSSTPLAFTNAALVGEGDAAAYVGAVLADLPRGPVFWDDHHKPYAEQARTPLRFVLATPALRWAYGLLLLAAVLYVAFRGRRWQRPIPVVAPPPNAQREFARTVGRLHLAHGDGRRLADRKVRLVLDRLRTDLRIAEPDTTPETATLAAARAGADPDATRALFARMRRLPTQRVVSPDDLIDLDRRIDALFASAAAEAFAP